MNLQKINYQKELEKVLDTLRKEGKVPTLLLHSCCAPCSSYVLEYLSEYFKITVFYYNPNIYPESEYTKRILEQQKLISEMHFTDQLLLLQNPFCIFTFRINIGIIIKDCDLEIFRQILQHITAARCTTAMEQKRGDFAFFP